MKTLRGRTDWVRDVSPSFDGKWLVSGGRDRAAKLWDVSSGEPKATLLGHEHFIDCCVFAPAASYKNLSAMAGQQKSPPLSNSAEFVATGARDKTVRIWDGRGTLIKTLVGHDNWIRGLVFHPGGKYLLSVADDKTIRCWDLSQDGRLVKTVSDAHGNFVTCIRWAPPMLLTQDAEVTISTTDDPGIKNLKIRCYIATGSADYSVRVF